MNGVRVLSMGLVVLGHTLYFMTSFGPLNQADVYPPHGALSTWTFQIIPSAEFAVDSFFMMSGFLVSLGILRQLEVGSRVCSIVRV